MIALTPNLVSWLVLFAFWVTLMCWPYNVKRGYGDYANIGEAVEGLWKFAFRLVFALTVTVIFFGVKLIYS